MKLSIKDEVVKEFLARYPNRTVTEAMVSALIELKLLDQLLERVAIRSHTSTSPKSSEESPQQK